VTVLNSTSTPGLAAAAAEVLGAAGWQVGEVGNYEGDEIPTAVLYPDGAADPLTGAVAAVTAAAVAADLGVGGATASPEVDGPHGRPGPRLRPLTALGPAATRDRTSAPVPDGTLRGGAWR
jgi:hypothetical protein